jgi:hypothetical protein
MSRKDGLVLMLLAALGLWSAACGESTPATPVTPTPPTCSYTFTSTTLTFGASGGQGTATLTTGPTCTWTAIADSSWVTITAGASGTGPGTVQFTIAGNSGTTARRANLSAGGQALAINQDGRAPCQYTVTATGNEDFPSSGGTGTVTVTAADGCAWTASSGDTWVTITSGASGSGNGTVSYSVAQQSVVANRDTMLTVAGQAVHVRQSGASPRPEDCEYDVSPHDVTEHWHGTGFTVTITTDRWCTWQATPQASWLSVNPTSGSGSVQLAVTHDIFTDDAIRQAIIELRWPTPKLGDHVSVTQAGCRYSVWAWPVDFPAPGGTGQISVATQPLSDTYECTWTPESKVSWIHVPSLTHNHDGDLVFYTVDPNTGALRTGEITVAGKVFRVRQAGS